MKTEEQLKLMAYLDNEVSSSEARQIASWIEKDAEARALYEELRGTKALLCAENEAAVACPDGRDFYWSKIARGIESAEREPAREVVARPWWIKLLAPVAGAAALALFVATSISTNPHAGIAQIEKSETDNSITFFANDHKTMIVWIPSGNDAVAAYVQDEDDFE